MYLLFRFLERKLSDLRIGVSGRYKHPDKNYDNVLGFGIPDLLLNLLSCQVLSKNNESVVILECPHRMFEYYFNKGFIFLLWWKQFKKTSISSKRQSWCRSNNQFRQSHAMLYHHYFHLKYTEELVSQFKLSFIIYQPRIKR